MTAKELKRKFLSFFIKKGHKKVPNASLVPENDPTALFINSGMHPLVPYLLGEPHPLGKRLASIQRCLRTQDIDKVGNIMHLTFFEMLGNWSLGDPASPDGIGQGGPASPASQGGYWKKEAIEWSWEFLTKVLELEPKRISVTCFAGDESAPKDEEAASVWRKIGIPNERIYFLGKDDNWWAVGEAGPCGPDTEMFYDTGEKKCGPNCRPGDNCGKYFEVWNDVFMEFNRLPNGKLEKLKQQNIDTGMGVERTTAMLQGKDDVYQTELFSSIIQTIEKISGKKYEGENQKPMRIIADHLRAATLAVGDGVVPSNVEAGYVLRRLIRRAIVHEHTLEKNQLMLVDFLERGYKFKPVIDSIIDFYKDEYTHLKEKSTDIRNTITGEWEKTAVGLRKGYPALIKLIEKSRKTVNGEDAFYLFETYGIQLEVAEQAAQKYGKQVDKAGFEKAFKKHQKISRAGVERKFAGGLADHSADVTKLHTATHLLHQALRDVLGKHVQQVGSNITPERLRFDFTYPEKLTEKQIRKVEEIINEKIKANLPVKMEMMSLAEAKKKGALAFFGKKYGEKVKVYSIGPSTSSGRPYSVEVCGGPHVKSTQEIRNVKIVKEKAIGAGRRRIYASLA